MKSGHFWLAAVLSIIFGAALAFNVGGKQLYESCNMILKTSVIGPDGSLKKLRQSAIKSADGTSVWIPDYPTSEDERHAQAAQKAECQKLVLRKYISYGAVFAVLAFIALASFFRWKARIGV